MRKDKVLKYAVPVITVLIILLLWALISALINNEYILPSVGETLKSFFALFSHGEFYSAFFGTLLRSVISFVVSFIIAFILAILSKYKNAKRVITLLIKIIRALPTVAVVLLLLFWTNSFVAPVIVTMLVILPTVYTNICNALLQADKKAVETCEYFSVPKKEIYKRVIIPEIKPSVYKTVGSGLSLNVKLMVAAEVLSETANSLGYMLIKSKVYFLISEMIALVLFSVIVGLIIETAFDYLSEKAGKWL